MGRDRGRRPQLKSLDPDSLAAQAELRAELARLDRAALLALLDRLATESSAVAERLRYLADPAHAKTDLAARIRRLRASKRFVPYRESGALAREVETLVEDLERDLLPRAPEDALALAEKLLALDGALIERCDDSGGAVGSVLRDAARLWVSAAAAVRALEPPPTSDWVVRLRSLYADDGYGVREPLLAEARRLLSETELRTLASAFELDARRALARAGEPGESAVGHYGPCSAIGLIAETLNDPLLYERSIRLYSPQPNELQAARIAQRYAAAGDAAGARRWLAGPWPIAREAERLRLLDAVHALEGDRASQITVRRKLFELEPGRARYRALQELLEPDAAAAFEAEVRRAAPGYADPVAGARLLFTLGAVAEADAMLRRRASDLDGRDYGRLPELAEEALQHGAVTAAVVIWRALLTSLLERAESRAYGHGARYLEQLRALAAAPKAMQLVPTHEAWEAELRRAHGRKTAFWSRLP
ncbi:MAG: DUF6880 family protein [Pseudomonadota bacterium]